MTVEPGELRAVIGPNGAGKTTFFNLITGFLRADFGAHHFRWRGHHRSAAGAPACGAVSPAPFKSRKCFPNSSVRENLRIPVEVASGFGCAVPGCRASRERDARAVADLLDMGGSRDKADRLVGELRHGDQRATEIMMALALKPSLLLLDEPTAGMGDQETYDITQLIRDCTVTASSSIVLIEHDMRVVFHLADRIMVLAEGAVLAEGTPDEIAANEAVQTAYLGTGGMIALGSSRRGGLHTYYGKSHILHGVGLEVREGEDRRRCSAATAPARPRRCAA